MICATSLLLNNIYLNDRFVVQDIIKLVALRSLVSEATIGPSGLFETLLRVVAFVCSSNKCACSYLQQQVLCTRVPRVFRADHRCSARVALCRPGIIINESVASMKRSVKMSETSIRLVGLQVLVSLLRGWVGFLSRSYDAP